LKISFLNEENKKKDAKYESQKEMIGSKEDMKGR